MAEPGFAWSAAEVGDKVAVSLRVLERTAPMPLASATVNRDRLVLTYDEVLDETSVPAAGDFAVSVDAGAGAAPSAVALDGAAVTLTLAAAVRPGQAVTLSYTAGATPLRDADGNPAGDLDGYSVTNVTAPALDAATPPAVTARSLVLTFDAALDGASVPAADAFTVAVDDAARTVSSVAVDGTTVTLTLARATVGGEAVTVAYARPSSDPLAHAAGVEVASFAATSVANRSAACPSGQPAQAFWTACLRLGTNGGSVGLFSSLSVGALTPATFERRGARHRIMNLHASSSGFALQFVADPGPAAGGWVLQAGETSLAIGAARRIGHGANLIFYWPGAGPAWTAADVGESVSVSLRDAAAPVLDSAAVDGDRLVLTFDEALDETSVPAPGDFTVSVDAGAGAPPSAVAVGGEAVTLTLAARVAPGQAVTVGYAAGASPVRDLSGNPAAGFDGRTVDNDTVPALDPATPPSVETKALVLTFDTALDGASVPGAGAFAVTVAGADRTVASVAASGRTVTLVLAEATVAGEKVTVAYTKPASDPLADPDGHEVADFAAVAVSNRSAPCPASAPAGAFWNACLTLGGGAGLVGFSSAFDTFGALDPAALTRDGEDYRIDQLARSADGMLLSFAADPGAALAGWELRIGDAAHDLGAATVHGAGTHTWNVGAPNGWSAGSAGDKVTVSLRDASMPRPHGTPVVTGKSLAVTFDEVLDTGSVPAADAFAVTVDDAPAAVSSVAVADRMVTLTLAVATVAGEAVAVAYAKPARSPLADPGGNEVASFAATPAANRSAACPGGQPGDVFWSACLTVGAAGGGSAFGFGAGFGALSPAGFDFRGAGHAIDALSMESGRARLSFAADPGAALAGWTLQVGAATFDLGGAAVHDAPSHTWDAGAGVGWGAAEAGDRVSVSLRDSGAPALDAAAPPAVEAKALVLTFDEALDEGSVPAAGGFTVTVDNAPATVSSVAVAGRTATLALAAGTVAGETVTVAYAKPATGATLSDLNGNEAAGFAAAPVANRSAACPAGQPAGAFWAACLTLQERGGRIGYHGGIGALSPTAFTLGGAAHRIDLLRQAGASGERVQISFAADPGAALAGWALRIGGTRLDLAGASADTTTSDPHTWSVPAELGWGAAEVGDRVSVSLAPRDTTPPALDATALPAVEAKALVLTFDEALDEDSVPAAGAFTVTVDGASRTVAGVSVSGRAVTLALAEATIAGEVVVVSYAKHAREPLRDPSGNEAAAFAGQAVANRSAACPGAADSDAAWAACLTVGEIAESVYGYRAGADAGALAPGGFPGHEVTSLTGSSTGSAIAFAAAPGAVAGGWTLEVGGVTLAFSDALHVEASHLYRWTGAGPSWGARHVGDKVTVRLRAPDAGAPSLSAATPPAVEGRRLVLTFDEALDGSSVPAPDAFTVRVAGTARTVAGVSVAGAAATLVLAEATVAGEGVTVAYDKPAANPLRDRSGNGNEVADIADTAVANRSAACPASAPEDAFWNACLTLGEPDSGSRFVGFSSAGILYGALSPADFDDPLGAGHQVTGLVYIGAEPERVSLRFAADPRPAANRWALQVGGRSWPLGTATYSAKTFTWDARGFAWSSADAGDKVTVGLRPAELEAPALSAATVAGDTLVLTFDEALDEGSEPAPAAFSVAVDGGAGAAPDAVAVSGGTVTLTLAAAVTPAQTVTLDYTVPETGRLRDLAGNPASALTGEPVANRTPDLVLSASGVAVDEEGGTATFEVRLAVAPSGTVTVAVTSGDPAAATVAPAALTFTDSDWYDAQRVTATGVTDTDSDHERVTVTLAASGGGYDGVNGTVTVTVDDDEANNPATGRPAISGTAAVGSTLAAAKGDLADEDGLPASDAGLSWQWVRADDAEGAGAADIPGATGTTYDLTADDAGKWISAKVSFTDDGSTAETRASAAAGPVAAVVTLALAPARIVESGSGNTAAVTATANAALDEAFTVTVSAAAVAPAVAGDFTLSAAPVLRFAAGATAATGSVTVTAVDNPADAADAAVTVSGTVGGGAPATVPDAVTLTIADDDEAPGVPAALAATAGHRAVRLTWTAGTPGTAAVTGHQYRRKEDGGSWGAWEDIPDSAPGGAAATRFTVTGLTNGTAYTFRVRAVSAAGAGAGSGEASATPKVNTPPSAAPDTVTVAEDEAWTFGAGDFNFSDRDAIDTLAGVRIAAVPAAGTLALGGTAVTARQVVSRADLDGGRLVFTPAANANGAGYASFAFWVSDGTAESASAYTMTIDVTPVNDPATGRPVITGAAQAGQELTAARGTIADADGVPETLSWQWVRVDGASRADIASATSATYTLGSDDLGKRVEVKASFTDGDGTAETRTSDATATVAADSLPPVLENATVDVRELTLAFGEDLDATSEPAPGAFTVRAAARGAAKRTIAVSDVSIAGSEVTLTLAAAVVAIDFVTVSYADPGASNDPLKDANGNRVATLTDREVANRTERAKVVTVGRIPQQWEININETHLVTHRQFRLAFTFDREVTGLDAEDFQVLNGDVATYDRAHAVSVVPGAPCNPSRPRTRCVLIQPTGGNGDPIRVALRIHAVDQGNDEASYQSVITAPGLTVDITTAATEPVTRNFRASVAFSSEVPQDIAEGIEVYLYPPPTYFSTEDIRIANGSPVRGTWTVTEGSRDHRAKDFSVLIGPRSGFEGTLTVTLPAGRVTSVAGTRNPEATLDVEVDTLGPTVTGMSAVSSPGDDGRYAAGDAIAVEVAFHEDVHVDDSDPPALTLDVGGTDREAAYDAGLSATAGTGRLVFTYLVVADDRDGDGVSVAADSLSGKARDVHGNRAPLTHAAQGPWDGHRVGAAPASADATVATDEDTDHTFAAGEFSFSDADAGDALAGVKITALPASGRGTLALDGAAIADGDLPKAVTRGEIDDDKLKYSPPANANGDGYATFAFKVNDGNEDSASAYTMNIDVTPVNDAATGAPAITGTAAVRDELTAAQGTVADVDGVPETLSWQWVRVDGGAETDIGGATAATYALADADVGKTIKVKASFTDGDGTDEVRTSAAYPSTGSVAAVVPGVVLGLSASANGQTGIDVTWSAPASNGGSAVTGYRVEVSDDGGSGWSELAASQAGTSYAHTGLTAGTTKHYRVSAINTVGTGAGATAAATTDTSANAAPTASDAEVTTDEDTGHTFAAGDFEFADTDADDSLANVKITALPGSGKGTLALDGTAVAAVDLPKTVTRGELDDDKLTYSPPANAHGDDFATFGFMVSDGTADSADTWTMTIDVDAVNDAPSGAPAISGTAKVGQTLSADVSAIADADGLGGVSWGYRWIRVDGDGTSNPADIANAVAATYALGLDDLGKRVKVKVSFTDDDGTDETLTSDAYPVSGTVRSAGALTLSMDAITGDDTVSIAEKAAGFAITGDTGSEAGVSVSVTIGSQTPVAVTTDAGGAWSVSVAADAGYITGTGVKVTVSASKYGYTAPDDEVRTLAIDLVAPTAPAYDAPAALRVGEAITAMTPVDGIDVDAYAATGLPPGLAIAADTGVIGGTPTRANANTARATMTVTDAAGNPATVKVTFPAVARGEQDLSGFAYSPATATVGGTAPTLTAPAVAESAALTYSTTTTTVCTVDSASGALTLKAAGSCTVTVTAAATANYAETTATFTVTVQSALALNVDAVAGDDTINIAEKAAGFAITGDTGSEAGVSVTVKIGTATLTDTSTDDAGTATWSVTVPQDAGYITGTSVQVTVSAQKSGFAAPEDVEHDLAIDLVAPTAPSYTPPSSLKVGEAMTDIGPSSTTGIAGFSASGLPPGLSIAADTGVIGGTPTTADSNTAGATVTVLDAAGNPATTGTITFPAVTKGEQDLSGFAYSSATATVGGTAPTLTAPAVAESAALTYSTTTTTVCTVDSASGALTLKAAGSCTVTVTAAATANYAETTATFTVTVQSALALNVDAVAGDDTINIAEKAAGFAITGDTGSEAGVSVTVKIGTATLTDTSTDDAGTATWSVTVPQDAGYITGTSVQVTVSAQKSGFAAPEDVEHDLAIDLVAPTAPSYTPPSSLKVGEAMTDIGPSSTTGIAGFSASGLPPGLSIAADTGVIGGTPTTADSNTAGATVTVLDAAGNPATTGTITFPAVTKGEQDLSGFAYSSATATVGGTAPTLTAPAVAESAALTYSTTTTTVCTVDSASGALTLKAAGSCTVTVTAAATANYAETTATFTVTVQSALALNVDAVAGDDTINIAEKAAGFAITGDTGSEAGVSVTVKIGTATLTDTSTDDAGTATWSVTVPQDASYITGTSVQVTVSAQKSGFAAPEDVEHDLAIDLVAPTAPSYTPPSSLKVGEAMTDIGPSSTTGIAGFSASGLPPGLSIAADTGVIGGTPTTADSNTAGATVTVLDAAGNPATVDITFPAVTKGEQDLSGFAYSSATATVGGTAPTLTAPAVAESAALTYSTTTTTVCTVDSASGALTLKAAGSCTVTVTAAATANYAETTGTFTVTVQSALALNVDAVADDDTINIAEKAAGFAITGDTGSEAGVSVTVKIGTATLTDTSTDDAGTATWSVTVPQDASYITGTSVQVTVSAQKSGFAAPEDVEHDLAIDLVAPTAPSYTPPSSLKVGEAMTDIGPSSTTGIAGFSASGLPPGLSIAADTGVIGGTPTTADSNTAGATVTVLDAAGNPATVDITFPAVTKGEQDLSGFAYSSATATVGGTAPTLTAPAVAESAALTYSTTTTTVCTVDSASGALTLKAAGSCTVTVTAAATANYAETAGTFTVTVQSALALNVDAVADDDTINIAEKAAGFAITGDTGSEAGVSVTVKIGTATLTDTSTDDAGTATWSVTVPQDASYITGTSVQVTVSAQKSGFAAPEDVEHDLAIDLVAPTAPSYTPPSSLKVGEAMTDIGPSSTTGIAGFSASGLPPGLSIAADTGVIGGTPTTADSNTAGATVTVLDAAGNPATVDITFPAVTKGEQDLSGFAYSSATATVGGTAPTLTAPAVAESAALTYSTTTTTVCTVDSASGALTLKAAGSCTVTVTAAATANYAETTATFTVTVQSALALNVDAVAGDDTINIAEKAAGFAITGDTGSEAGVSVTVKIGTATLTDTSTDDAGTATWSVTVPQDASYITGTSVQVTVSAQKSGFAAPEDVEHDLAIDLVAPTAPSYTPPSSLKVGEAMTDIGPSSTTGIAGFSASGLPPGLSIAADTGVIGGTPTTADSNTAGATVTVLDAAGNPATVDITFPAVTKGEQDLSGFAYSSATATVGGTAPTLTAPAVAESAALTYSTTTTTVCTVDSASGALTLKAAGSCTVTVTAAATANYAETTGTFTVTVQSALALNVDAVADDDTINIAEKAAGFAITGDTGSEAGVSVTVKIGTATLTDTSTDDAGTATWSVTVPQDASYITGTSVQVTVSAQKSGFAAPEDVEHDLAIDLVAPTAPSYTPPSSLKVGEAMTDIGPSSTTGIAGFSASGLPPGLSIAADTGVIGGTPTTADSNTAGATVTVLDAAGNPATVDITFPAVTKGEQDLSGFAYSSATATVGGTAPTLTAPAVAESAALTYSTTTTTVCTVDSASGALTLKAAGSCTVTVTAAATANYAETAGTFTVTVQAAAGAPGAPTVLVAVAGDALVKLAWTAPAEAGTSPVTGYEYQRKIGSGSWGAWTATGHGLGVHHTVTGLTNASAYAFRVRAVNAVGAGPASAEAEATPDTGFRPVIMGDSTAAQATTFRITITFGRDVPELRRKALVVGGGKLVEQGAPAPPRMSRPNGREWTAHVEPTYGFTGWLTIDIPAGAVRDKNGNPNVAAVQYRRLIKAVHVRPRLYMRLASDPETGVVHDPSEPVSGPFKVRLLFTSGSILHQPVTGLELDDIVVTNGTKTNLVQERGNHFEGDYEVKVTPDPTYTGPFTITVEEGAAYACNDLDDLATCDETNLSLGDTLVLDVVAPNSRRQLDSDLQGKPQQSDDKRLSPSRSPSDGSARGCAVEVTVRFRDGEGEGEAVAVEGLAASHFTVTNGRLGAPSVSADGLAWTVPGWAAPGHTGLMRVRLAETGRWRGSEQVFRVRSATECAPVARNALHALSLEGLDLDPAFETATRTYTAAAPSDTDMTTVTATAVYGASALTFAPGDADTETEGHQVALAAGETQVRVTVTPQREDVAAKSWTVTVTREAGAGVLSGFTLVDASDQSTVAALSNGAQVDLGGRSGGSFAIRADVASHATVGSVVLSLTGAKTVSRTENLAPYSLWGDHNDGNGGRALDGASLPAGTYTLSATAYAEGGGAGEALGTRSVSFEVLAPALLSVADARAEEGTDATLDFAVTLDRSSTGTVTVEYATSDGTATAGDDYTATSGTLTFAPGEREKTVAVAVLDDEWDEGEETMTLRLSNPSGANIADGEATGTITNSDPIQKMWLARFGRTVGSQVVDAVAERLGSPLAGAQVTLGGQGVDLTRTEDGEALAQALVGVARIFGAESVEEDDAEERRPGAGAEWREAWGHAQTGPETRSMSGRDVLLGSAFHFSRSAEDGGPGFAAWGRVTAGGFDAQEQHEKGPVDMDGEVTTGIVGADAAWERWLAGVAVSVSEGEGTYAYGDVGSGKLESTLTGVHPYARVEVNDRVQAWGLLGFGAGEMTMRPEGKDPIETDIDMRLGAVGAQGALMEAGETGGVDLVLKADAFLVQMESARAPNTEATQADASRLRLALEGSRTFALGESAALTPGLEVGLRHDGGDAETGTGVELGGRIAYANAASGLSVETSARTLIAHEDSGYEEWGASGSVRLDPGASGRGLSFTLAPTLGAASSGVERLWSLRDAQELANDDEFEVEGRLDAKVGYGLAVLGRFTGTPYAGLGLSESGRDYRLGWRVSPGTTALDFELGVEGTWSAPAEDEADPQRAVLLRGALKW